MTPNERSPSAGDSERLHSRGRDDKAENVRHLRPTHSGVPDLGDGAVRNAGSLRGGRCAFWRSSPAAWRGEERRFEKSAVLPELWTTRVADYPSDVWTRPTDSVDASGQMRGAGWHPAGMASA